MQRLLLVSLWCTAAACASSTAGTPATSPNTAPPAGTVCNDEVFSARGTVGEHCYTKRQLDDQKRFVNDTKLDPARRPFNN